jgi:hypothetical protein
MLSACNTFQTQVKNLVKNNYLLKLSALGNKGVSYIQKGDTKNKLLGGLMVSSDIFLLASTAPFVGVALLVSQVVLGVMYLISTALGEAPSDLKELLLGFVMAGFLILVAPIVCLRISEIVKNLKVSPETKYSQ